MADGPQKVVVQRRILLRFPRVRERVFLRGTIGCQLLKDGEVMRSTGAGLDAIAQGSGGDDLAIATFLEDDAETSPIRFAGEGGVWAVPVFRSEQNRVAGIGALDGVEVHHILDGDVKPETLLAVGSEFLEVTCGEVPVDDQGIRQGGKREGDAFNTGPVQWAVIRVVVLGHGLDGKVELAEVVEGADLLGAGRAGTDRGQGKRSQNSEEPEEQQDLPDRKGVVVMAGELHEKINEERQSD